MLLLPQRHDGKPHLQTEHSSTFDEITVVIVFINVQVKLLQAAHSSDILQGDSSNQHRAAVSFLTCAENNRQQLKALSE